MKNRSLLKFVAGGAVALTAYKYTIVDALEHFSPDEFRGEWVFLSVGLLQKLDEFRDRLGRKVWPSPEPGTMIRFGPGSSQHYFGRAIDVIIEGQTRADFAFQTAIAVGFTGIGIYPNSGNVKGRLRMHLDIRPDRQPGDPATWGHMDGKEVNVYTAIRAANASVYALI